MSRHPFSRRSRRRIRKGERRYPRTTDPARMRRLLRNYMRKQACGPMVRFTGYRMFLHQLLSKRVRKPRRVTTKIRAWIRRVERYEKSRRD